MGYYLGVSNIILIFVLSMRLSRRVQPTVGVAEGRLRPTLYIIYKSPLLFLFHPLVRMKYYLYLYTMVFVNLILMGLIIIGVSTLISFTFIYLCMMVLSNYPHSKLSTWIRHNVIMDSDLEP